MEVVSEQDDRHYGAHLGVAIIGHGSFPGTSQRLSNIKLLPSIISEIHDIYTNNYLKSKKEVRPKTAFIQLEAKLPFTTITKQTRSPVPIDINAYTRNFIDKVKTLFFIRSCPQEYLCINRIDPELGSSDIALKYAFFNGINRNVEVTLLQNCLRLLEIIFVANQFNDFCIKSNLPFNMDTLHGYFVRGEDPEKIAYLNAVYSKVSHIYSKFDDIYDSLIRLISLEGKLINKKEMAREFSHLLSELLGMNPITCAKFQEFNISDNTQIKTYFFHENEYDGLYLYDIETNHEIHIHPRMTPDEIEHFKQFARTIYHRQTKVPNDFELFLLDELIDMMPTDNSTTTVSSNIVIMLLTLINIKSVSLDLTCSTIGNNKSTFDSRNYIPSDTMGFGIRKTSKNKQKNNLKKKKTINKRKNNLKKKKSINRRKSIYA